MNKKILFLPIIFCFPAFANAASIQATLKPATLSMQQAIKEALKRKPSIQAHQYAITDYKRQQQATLSPYLPNISLSEKFYNTSNSSSTKSAFGLQASQTILSLSQQSYHKLYGSYVSSARHSKESHIDEIRLATETAFLNAWLSQQKIKLIIKRYDSSKKTFVQVKKQHNLGLLDKNNWLKSQATHASNLATVNSYKQELAQTEKTLEYYTGLTLRLLPTHGNLQTKLIWEPEKKINLDNFKAYFDKALKNRKDLKIKQDTINSERYSSQYYANQYIPSVSLFGSATKYTSRVASSSTSKEAGLQLSWNVFDGLSNYFHKQAAGARKMKAVLEKSDAVIKIKSEVQTAYTALDAQQRTLSAQTISHEQSKNEFDLKKQQESIGLISSVDLETAKYSWQNSHYTWLSSAASTALKTQELAYACGYPQKGL
ncbi:TolC family protein [Candidatus Babeliales bacterium]|nr:TolC family protein [Candidatus Babeliales bacterium]